MALPNNILQQVQTYQPSLLGYLQNSSCAIHTFNKRFKDFENKEANLGSAVGFELPFRYVTNNTLVATFQGTTERIQTLAVDQAINASVAFSAQQFIFNTKHYMEQVGKGCAMELATRVEKNVLLNAISGVRNNDPTSPGYGTLNVTSGPYRFFGSGNNAINSFGQLGQMFANFKAFGVPEGNLKCYLPLTIVPQIVNSGLNQFTMERNDEMAKSWFLGRWDGVEFYQSNLLPVHYAGNVGINGTTLTLISTNDPTGNNVTQLTFSGATAGDSQAVKAGDLFQFQLGVSSFFNPYFLTFSGHSDTPLPFQFRATADAAANGSGDVTISVTPVICWASGNATQNISTQLVAGMEVQALPSHLAGLIVAGEGAFLAMPRLPDETPYPTANQADPETGASMRMYYGSLFGQNQRGMIHDCVWGSTIVQEYSMRIAFPLTQSY